MNKKFVLIFIFWWSLIFPSLSFNSFTTDLTNSNIDYSDLSKKETRTEILKNAEFTFWMLK